MREYKVRQSVTDIIEIEVEAMSDDEAISVANGIDLTEWDLIWSTTNSLEVELIKETGE